MGDQRGVAQIEQKPEARAGLKGPVRSPAFRRNDAVRNGEHTRPRVSRPAPSPVGRRSFQSLNSEEQEALSLFSEGAEQSTRGACAPHRLLHNYGFRRRRDSKRRESNTWISN